MKVARYSLKGLRAAMTILGATLALVLLLVCFAGLQTRAAPLRTGTGTDPRVEAITVNASMPISDTRPGDGVAKTVYFRTPGVLTLTLAISGTPTLTLATDAAFGEPARMLTSTDSSWDAIITYTVVAEEGDWPDIAYAASNASEVQTTVPITYLRDTAAPTVDIDHPAPGTWISGPVTLSGTATDGTGAGVQQVEVRSDVDTEWMAAAGTSPWAYVWAPPADQNGAVHTLFVRAIDFVGLASSPPASRVVTVDNVMAGVAGNLTSTTHLVDVWSNQNMVTVTWSPADDGPGSGLEGYAILWNKLPGSVPAPIQSLDSAATETFATLGDGAGYYFHIRAVDQMGNWAAAAAHLGPIKVDTVPPTWPALLSPLSGTVTHVADVTFDWSDADDGGSGIARYNIDLSGEIYTTTESIMTTTLPGDGVYTWTVRACDHAGSCSGYADPWTITFNDAPSKPTLLSPADGTLTRTASIEFTWSNVGADNYNLWLDGEVYTTPETSMTRVLDDGAHSWTAQALDEEGDASGYTDTWELEIDSLPPGVPALLSPLDGTETSDPTPTFDWEESSGDPVGYNVEIDGNVYTTTLNTYTPPSPLGEGAHGWRVRAYDGVGNDSAWSALWTVTVDTQPPGVPVLLSPPDGSATGDATPTLDWEGSSGDPAGYNVEIDGNVYTATLSIYTPPSPLGEGVHDWRVRAYDGVGNDSAWSALWTVTVDTLPPGMPALLSPLDGTLTGTMNVTFDWSDADDGGGSGVMGYNIDLNGEVYTTSASMTTTTLPGDGLYAWTVWAFDAVGNASGYPDPWTLTVDTVLPEVTIVAPSEGAVLTTSHPSTLLISGTALDVGTGLNRVEINTGAGWQTATGTSSWTYAWTLPAADNLEYTLTARAFDNAGNESAWTDVTVVVDRVAPSASAPVPHRSPWVTSTVVYTWAPSSDGAGIAGYQVRVTNDRGYDALFPASGPEFTFTEAYVESAAYQARVQALDGRGNWGPWSALSVVVLPDLTVPSILTPSIVEDSAYLHAVGTQLYYTNTMLTDQTFVVRGYSSDFPSGVKRVTFSPAFDEQPADDTAGFWPWQSSSPNYGVDPGATSSGVIVATVYDYADNKAIQTYTYALDERPPESIATSPISATSSPIFVSWTAVDTQSGTYSTTLYYKKETTGTWTPYQTLMAGSGTFLFAPPEGNGLYLFATVAEDNLGNLEAGPTVSETQTVYDIRYPQSEVAWAPAYANSNPIAVTWVATRFLASLVEVRLWYRFDGDTWQATELASTDGSLSGLFSFAPPDGDGAYDFATVARDADGKSEASPYDGGDATTLYDTQIAAPELLQATPADWTATNLFALTWSNPPDLSGIAGAYYKLDAMPASPYDGTWVEGDDLEEIDGILVGSEGAHTVWVWLMDRAGNVDLATVRATTLKYDASVGAPVGLVADPSAWTPTDGFSATWSNPYPPDVSGIVGAYFKLDEAPAFPGDGTWVAGDDLERIDGISVGSEGVHTLHVWLQDKVGNVDLDTAQMVDLHYDATPPTDVTIAAPDTTLEMSFVVSWSAADFVSGVVFYTVEYSGTAYAEWQPWLSFTTQTSAWFTVPAASADYTFRVTAYDYAWNSDQAQTTTWVEPQRVYLPLTLHRWRDWYAYDVYEPNDTADEAFGPLKSGQDYWAYIWNETDPDDYYYFVPSTDADVVIWLTNIPTGTDYDLYVYYYDGQYRLHRYSNRQGNADEYVTFEPVPGRKYWVRVFPYDGFSSGQPYHLVVTYQ